MRRRSFLGWTPQPPFSGFFFFFQFSGVRNLYLSAIAYILNLLVFMMLIDKTCTEYWLNDLFLFPPSPRSSNPTVGWLVSKQAENGFFILCCSASQLVEKVNGENKAHFGPYLVVEEPTDGFQPNRAIGVMLTHSQCISSGSITNQYSMGSKISRGKL